MSTRFIEEVTPLRMGVDVYNPDVEAREMKFVRLKNIQPRLGRWMTPQGFVVNQVLDAAPVSGLVVIYDSVENPPWIDGIGPAFGSFDFILTLRNDGETTINFASFDVANQSAAGEWSIEAPFPNFVLPPAATASLTVRWTHVSTGANASATVDLVITSDDVASPRIVPIYCYHSVPD